MTPSFPTGPSSDLALIDLPERAPAALLADKGYDADAIRANLAERNTEAVIPGRSNRRVKIEHDRTLYKQRNRIERLFGQININRAIATRYRSEEHTSELQSLMRISYAVFCL